MGNNLLLRRNRGGGSGLNPTVRKSEARAGSDSALKTVESQAERPQWCARGRTDNRLAVSPADSDDDPGGPGKKLNPTQAAMPDVVP